jgi:ankyrin repeat protein
VKKLLKFPMSINMEFRNVVFNAARDGKLRRLKVFLDHRPRHEVHQLVSARTNGATPLVLSCRNGHKDVVEYLVERCSADVEQPGSVTFDGETIEGAPPLWCAAAAGHTQIVKLLCDRGASVNSVTKTNSTPLRAACFDGHYEIVKYLVEHGADIEVANRHGHTCLMIACYKGHLKIAKYLIDAKSDVNRKSVKGNTALHDCAESGSLEIMMLLLANGANIDVDAYGMTPLLAASVTGHIHIVEYLIANPDLVSRQERIDALELLGATFVDKKRDMLGSFKLWKRAMEDRFVDEELVCPKVVLASPIAAYENTVEVSDLSQLEEIISDPDGMRMQALLVRERILGPAHPDTSYYIRYRGAVYADMGHFERCITLWMYALDMQQKMLEPLSPMTQSSLLSFAELFSYMMSEGRNRNGLNNSNQRRSPPVGVGNGDGNGVVNRPQGPQGAPNHSSSSAPNHPPVNFCDIMAVFEKAVAEVRQGQDAFCNTTTNTINTQPERDITYFNRTLVIILHLICLLTKLLPHLDSQQSHQVKKAVYEFLKVGARGRGGATPLHLACSRDSSAVGRYPICQFPSVEVISLLVECGAEIDARDHEDNSALHISALNKPAKSTVVGTLLDSGAHLDAVNADGRTFQHLLRGQPLHEVVTVLKYSNLQCLAAKTIQKHNIPHWGKLPAKLSEFVQLH